MALETTAILRSTLYHAMKAKTTKDVVNAISVMCSKEDIATVKEQIAREQAEALADLKEE
jgi:hypothetical protein